MDKTIRMTIPESCAECGRTFKNVFSVSAHKSHCPVRQGNVKDRFGDKRAWSRNKHSSNDKRIKCKWTVDQIFIENSLAKRSAVKSALLAEGRGKNCELCEIKEWNDKPLTLHLDHINGIRNDNRRENLRFLCPNCHSQTETYCRTVTGAKNALTDRELIDALKSSTSISSALDKLNRAGGRKIYARCIRLAERELLQHILDSLR